MAKIVFNSSPIIFLSRLNYLSIFLENQGNDEFFLPNYVAEEIAVKTDIASINTQKLINQKLIKIKTVNLISMVNSLNNRLGKGESEAITLATELQADYLILDDLAARKEAKRLGLNVKGTLAIIKKMEQEKVIKITNFDEFYNSLIKVNFRVNKSIFDKIFKD